MSKQNASVNDLVVDVCLVGGGMIGAAAAIALAKIGYRVCLVERAQPLAFDLSQKPDLRVSALNQFSIALLKTLGAWTHITKMRYRDYTSLEVSEGDTHTAFDASSVGYEALGTFVENRVIQLALMHEISQQHSSTITTIYDVDVASTDADSGNVQLSNGQRVSCSLIVGADGANSIVRKDASIGTTGWEYALQANLISVELENDFESCTWQAFKPTGPVAFLPMHQRYASLVWYADKQHSKKIALASKPALTLMIKDHFPNRLGNFKVIDSSGFGLTRMHVNQYFKAKSVLIGDAAHTINPLAGQGVNLGFKDVAALSDGLSQFGIKENLSKSLSHYSRARRSQNLAMMTAMDVIYNVFKVDASPISVFRKLGLKLAQHSGPLKTVALKYATGLNESATRK